MEENLGVILAGGDSDDQSTDIGVRPIKDIYTDTGLAEEFPDILPILGTHLRRDTKHPKVDLTAIIGHKIERFFRDLAFVQPAIITLAFEMPLLDRRRNRRRGRAASRCSLAGKAGRRA